MKCREEDGEVRFRIEVQERGWRSKVRD